MTYVCKLCPTVRLCAVARHELQQESEKKRARPSQTRHYFKAFCGKTVSRFQILTKNLMLAMYQLMSSQVLTLIRFAAAKRSP